VINSSLDSHTCPCHAAKYSQAASERETSQGNGYAHLWTEASMGWDGEV